MTKNQQCQSTEGNFLVGTLVRVLWTGTTNTYRENTDKNN